jgi:hypothetical protein
MRSSPAISLFSERSVADGRPFPFLASFVAHGVAIGVLSFGIIYTPVIKDPVFTVRYTVRHLDLHTKDTSKKRSAPKAIPYPAPHESLHQSLKDRLGGGKVLSQLAAMRQTIDAKRGPQTLLQPEIPHKVSLKEPVKVPTVLIWTPQRRRNETHVAPLPDPPASADVKSSANAPNQEVNLADLTMAAADSSFKSLILPPSTTSPLVVHGPEHVQLAPATASEAKTEPTPAAVMSQSDVRMTDGHVILPPVNESAPRTPPGALAPGKAGEASLRGAGNEASDAGGVGRGMDIGDATGPGGGDAKPAGAATWPAPAQPADAGDPLSGMAAHITLPSDGQFGAVVVGASMQEQFPEIAGLWNDRMAYTVFLHVGLSKSWILQYSLPLAEEAEAGGNVMRLDAPWPYNIVRPNLAPGAIGADALMVHGFVNRAGRFERLTVAFPPEFSKAQFVLEALEQWQFRPAAQSGRSERVEVVLIIPEEVE